MDNNFFFKTHFVIADHHHRIRQPDGEYGTVAGLPVEKDLENDPFHVVVERG